MGFQKEFFDKKKVFLTYEQIMRGGTNLGEKEATLLGIELKRGWKIRLRENGGLWTYSHITTTYLQKPQKDRGVKVEGVPPRCIATNNPWVLYFDGACEVDKVATYGWVWYAANGKTVGYDKGLVCTGDEATNNRAEFQALIEGLDHYYTSGVRRPILCKGDSQLVVEIVNGRWKAHKPHIALLREIVWDLLEMLDVDWEVQWIPREVNGVADRFSHEAYNEYQTQLEYREFGEYMDRK